MTYPSVFGLWAQDSTRTTILEEVVVSASRTEQPMIEVPRSVTVINEQQIRGSVYQSLGDLLNAHTGLFVVGANQTPGTNQNVFLRGANSNQVAVLIDGVRITDPSTPNAAIDLSEISLNNIERIEVIRGSHSTIFGGSAVGGAINLITKKNSRAGLHGGIAWQGGSFGRDAWSSTANANAAYRLENGLYFNGAIFRQDVWGLDATEDVAANQSFTADRDDFRKTDGSMKAGFRNSTWDASLTFRKSHQYTEIDNGAYADDDNSYLIFDRNHVQYEARYRLNSTLTLGMLGSVSKSGRFFENDSSVVAPGTWDRSYSTGSYDGELQTHEIQLNYDHSNGRAVLGAGVYREEMFFNSYFFYNDPSYPFESRINYDSLDPKTSTRYVFAQGAYNVERFELSAGARLSSHTIAGNFMTVEVNPSYSTGDLTIYGSLSTGFNPPSLYQLYDPSRSFMAHTARGNRDLQPERSLSLEGGIKKQFASGNWFTISAYQTSVTNAIEYIYLWNGDKPLNGLDYSDHRGDTYINVGENTVSGIEAEGSVNLHERVSLLANVTFLKAQITMDADEVDQSHSGGHHVQLYNVGVFLDDDFELDDLVRRPSMTAYANAGYRLSDKFSVNAIYRYTGNRFDSGYDPTLGPYGALARIDVDAYHLVDLGATWQAKEDLVIAVKAENVFDTSYRELVGFQTRGRSIYLKASVRF